MREIKFRAWHRGFKCWLDEISVYSDGSWQGAIGQVGGYDETECDLMQYTGLHDKNGKEIYEGDIVKIWDYGFKDGDEDSGDWGFHRDAGTDKVTMDRFPVYWLENEAFGWEGEDLIVPEQCEVIGDIYDNPDLLEEK